MLAVSLLSRKGIYKLQVIMMLLILRLICTHLIFLEIQESSYLTEMEVLL